MALTRTPRLGELERQVMDIVWDASGPVTTRAVLDSLDPAQGLAYTTVATVLGNLVRKGMVSRASSQRVLTFTAQRPRSAYVAALMHDALATTENRETAFMHFVQESSAEDLLLLRRLLDQPGGNKIDDAGSPASAAFPDEASA